MNDRDRDQGLKCLSLDLGQTFSDLIHIWRRHVLILFLENKIELVLWQHHSYLFNSYLVVDGFRG